MPGISKSLSPFRVRDVDGNDLQVTFAVPALLSLMGLIIFHSIGVGITGALWYARLQHVEAATLKQEAALELKASKEQVGELEKRVDRKELETQATLREIQNDIKTLLQRVPPPPR